MNHHQQLIESAYENITDLTNQTAPSELKVAISETIQKLDHGQLRVAERKKCNDNQDKQETKSKKGKNSEGKSVEAAWVVNQWLKKAVLLYFRLHNNVVHTNNICHYYDKVPLKYQTHDAEDFQKEGVRVVPGTIVRHGAFVGANTVLMPCFVNIGAYIDTGCMIDTWATVGSCAQIGKNVHLSGGAGIGGVLEPLQANPTIIEDNCFIGARSEVAEGVIVEQGAVLAMGTFISQSTKIIDRQTDKIYYGRVPENAVVVPGSLPSATGKCHLNCAVIVKYVDEKTKQKTGINQILRECMDA